MIRRLVESDIFNSESEPPHEKILFWLKECRTPDLLISLAEKYPETVSIAKAERKLLEAALENDLEKTEQLLRKEEEEERRLDREYWAPLKAELARLRRKK